MKQGDKMYYEGREVTLLTDVYDYGDGDRVVMVSGEIRAVNVKRLTNTKNQVPKVDDPRQRELF